jgi:hypothetical protein
MYAAQVFATVEHWQVDPVRQTTREISTEPDSGWKEEPRTREMYAIVVGVGRFEQEAIPSLQGARNDAEDFHKLLVELGVPAKNIKVLTDEAATRKHLDEALRELPSKPNVAVLVYIATHGGVFRNSGGDELGFLLLHDSQVYGAFPTTGSPYLTEAPDAISTQEFLSRVHTARGDHKLIAIDACYAGHARWDYLRNAVRCDPSFRTIVLCACDSRQVAYESQNGRFTAAMMEALRALWAQGRRFRSSTVHEKINEILDFDPHFEETQQPQLFSYAGEGEFWFEPAPGTSVPSDTLQELEAAALFDKTVIAQQFQHLEKAGVAVPDEADQLESIRSEKLREKASEVRSTVLGLVKNGDFDRAFRLAELYSSLAKECAEWQSCIDSLPAWRKLWEDAVRPSRILAGEGRYAEALELIETLVREPELFPALTGYRLEWSARATHGFHHQRHWDGLEYVQLPSGVWLSQTPVTVAAFCHVMKTRGIVVRTRQALREPIVNRRFQDACAYCAAVGGRLPFSEEWVSAARSHATWQYPWGNDISADRAQFRAFAPCEVGRFQMTPTGFYDIAGNVWEWCADPPTHGTARIVRGGSFRSGEEELRVEFVIRRDPTVDHEDVGFRSLLETPPAVE